MRRILNSIFQRVMIVNYTEEGWSIIMQRSHGLLAAQICGYWRKDRQPARWVETLIATAEHDDVENELSRPGLLLKSGGPKNFKMNPFDKVRCDQLLELAMSKGRYVGLLIARHIQFLYAGEPSGRQYCRTLKKKEKQWLAEAKTTSREISSSYELLEFCDAFSLLICQQLMQPENRKMEISSGPDGESYQLSVSGGGELNVVPWPFEEDSFEVNYESLCMKQLTFKNDSEFRSRLRRAQIHLHTVVISKAR
jgi:hypothetical protein